MVIINYIKLYAHSDQFFSCLTFAKQRVIIKNEKLLKH